ncbi:MAG TPA: molecular chaperone DnaK [Usitatibacteraceae bacterium]|nr:molecular chaperone DnaK [Usitatibacteraceae bacterium]
MAITKYDALLEAKRDTVLEELRQAESSAAPVALDQSAVGRLSRIDAMQQQAMALNHVQRLRTELRKVDAAIDRLAAGSYGICCRCDEKMTPERLQVDPAAPFCQECIDETSPPRDPA